MKKLSNIYENILIESGEIGFLAFHGSPTEFSRFSDEFVGAQEAVDQEGPGVYFSTSHEDSSRYGKHVYTVKLRGRFLSDEASNEDVDRGDVEKMIRMANEWEMTAQNWGEDYEAALPSIIDNFIEYNPNQKDVFLQVWIDFYREDSVLFVRNMVKLGYDGIVVDRSTDEYGIAKHIIMYNLNAIKFLEKETLSEELTYRHANTDGVEDDKYEIGMVKENEEDMLSQLRFNDGRFNKHGANTIFMGDNPIIDFGVGEIGQIKTHGKVYNNALYLQGGYNASIQKSGHGTLGINFIFYKLPRIQHIILQCLDSAKGFWDKMGAVVIGQKPYGKSNNTLYTMVITRK